MSIKFSQREVEDELQDYFPNGTIRAVSLKSGIKESYLGRGINPNDDHVSFAYRLLQVQTAFDEANPEMGEKHWQSIQRFRELSLPTSDDLLFCIKTETAKLDKEVSDVTGGVLTGAPLYDLLTDALQARDQADRNVAAILRAINKEKSEGGQTRIPPRQFAQQVIRQKNGRRA